MIGAACAMQMKTRRLSALPSSFAVRRDSCGPVRIRGRTIHRNGKKSGDPHGNLGCASRTINLTLRFVPPSPPRTRRHERRTPSGVRSHPRPDGSWWMTNSTLKGGDSPDYERRSQRDELSASNAVTGAAHPQNAAASPLIVTRGDGVPLPDQTAAIEQFKAQGLHRAPSPAEWLPSEPDGDWFMPPTPPDVVEYVRKLEAHAARSAERVRELERQLAQARFSPMGDNHHNALLCPHCNPDRAKEGGKT